LGAVVLDQQGIINAGMSSKVKAQTSQDPVLFADVKGVDEAKQDLEEIVEFLKSSKKYVDIGGRLSKGVLLHGPVCFFLIE
jgi:ATP-dependent Zn protease